MQKTKRYQKAFSKGLQIWITPHWQRLHGFGLAVKEQTHQTHGMPKYFFFFCFECLLLPLQKEDEQNESLLSCLQFFSTQTRLWMTVLALKWLLFPQARRREKMEALHTSACPNPPLPCNHWDGELVLSTGAHRDICTVDKMSGESWAPTISHNRMRNLLQLLLPAQRNPALDEFSRAGGKGLPSLLETTPRCSPRHDRQQSCVSLLLANLPQD